MEKMLDIQETLKNHAEEKEEEFFNLKSSETCMEKAWKLHEAGELKLSKEYALQALVLNPNYEEAYIHLGYLAMRESKLDEARQYFQTAKQIHPEGEQGYIGMGHLFLKENKTQEALQQFKKAESLNKNNAGLHIGLGNAFFQDNQPMQALLEYQEALKIEPFRAKDIFLSRGFVFKKYHLFSDALREFQQVIEIDPSYIPARMDLAECLKFSGNNKQALLHYRLLLKLVSEESQREYIKEQIAQLSHE